MSEMLPNRDRPNDEVRVEVTPTPTLIADAYETLDHFIVAAHPEQPPVDRMPKDVIAYEVSPTLREELRARLEEATARLAASLDNDSFTEFRPNFTPDAHQHQLIGLVTRGYELLGEDSPLTTATLRQAAALTTTAYKQAINAGMKDTELPPPYRYPFLHETFQRYPDIRTDDIRDKSLRVFEELVLQTELEAKTPQVDPSSPDAPPLYGDNNGAQDARAANTDQSEVRAKGTSRTHDQPGNDATGGIRETRYSLEYVHSMPGRRLAQWLLTRLANRQRKQ